MSGRRRGFSCRTVVLGSLALFCCIIGVGAFGYFGFIRYERVAALHLPPGTRAAARVDVEKVVLFEPVRKHLFPLTDIGARHPESRLARLEKRTGIVLRREIREVVVARGAESSDWVVIVGGRFSGGLIPSVEELLAEEGLAWVSKGGIIVAPGGAALGQAEDGALIFAASERLLNAALPSQAVHEALGLERSGAGSLAVEGAVISGPASSALALVVPGLRELRLVSRLTATIELSDPPTLRVTLELARGSDVERFRRGIEALVGALGALASATPGGDFAGESAALASASVSSGEGRVIVTLPWRQADIDRGAESLARFVRSERSE